MALCIRALTELYFRGRILNFTPDLSYYETRMALHRAFSLWSDVTKLEFYELQSGHADILIEFASGYHHDGYPFDGQGRFSCVISSEVLF